MMRLIREVPCEETFFLLEEIPKNVRLTPRLIEINYTAYSPFESPDFFYIQKNGRLMIWFYPKKTFFSYPDCLSWLVPYVKRNFSGILIKKSKGKDYVFPMKSGIILGQYIVDNSNFKILIENLKTKYSLIDVKFVESSAQKDIFNLGCLLLSFFAKKLLSEIEKDYRFFLLKLLYLLVFINIVFLIIGLFHLVLLGLEFKKIEKERKYYSNIAEVTKRKFFFMEKRNKEWQKINVNFPYFEKNVANLFKALKSSSIQKIISFDAFYLGSKSEFKIYMNILSEGAPKFLSELSSLKNLKRIRILDSYPKGDKKVYKLLIELSISRKDSSSSI